MRVKRLTGFVLIVAAMSLLFAAGNCIDPIRLGWRCALGEFLLGWVKIAGGLAVALLLLASAVVGYTLLFGRSE